MAAQAGGAAANSGGVSGVQQVGRSALKEVEVLPHPDTDLRKETRSFSRTWQWVITSNGSASGYQSGKVQTIDEGWQVIPYHYLDASMTAPDFQELVSNASSIKILNMGFEIGRMVMTKEEIKATTGTDIRADFVSEPTVMHIYDKNHEWSNMVVAKADFDSTDFGCVSSNLTNQWMTSYQEGKLIDCVWRLPDNFNGPLYVNEDLKSFNVMCSLNDPTMNCIKDGYKFVWDNGSHEYALGTYMNIEGHNIDPEILCMQDIAKQHINSMPEVNTETNVNHFKWFPPLHLVRVTPYFSPSGPIEQACTIFVKCFSTVEVVKRPRSILTINKRPVDQGASLATDSKRLAFPPVYAGPTRSLGFYKLGHKLEYMTSAVPKTTRRKRVARKR